MITYIDKILYLYPGIQRVSYFHTQSDGTPWQDPYDGIVWENESIPKPTKEALDQVTDYEVQTDKYSKDREALEKQYDADIVIKSSYLMYKSRYPEITFSRYIDLMHNGTLKELDLFTFHDAKIETLQKNIENCYKIMQNIEGAFQALHGFLLMLPKIEKSISSINEISHILVTNNKQLKILNFEE
jgi:hypothetical protein